MQDPEGEIQKISEFLGFNYDTSFIKEVAEKCNFKNMKNANKDTKYTFGGAQTADIGQVMFRKGIQSKNGISKYRLSMIELTFLMLHKKHTKAMFSWCNSTQS